MATLIDDFTTGPHEIKLDDNTPEDRIERHGEMLGGNRRTVAGLDVRRNHGQPAFLGIGGTGVSDGEPRGLNLTLPVDAPATLGVFYGERGGILVDWSQAQTMQIDVASYTSFLPTTFTVAVMSDDGGRSKWEGSFIAPPEARVVTLRFKDVNPETTGANLQRIRQIDFSFAFNGSIRMRSFKVV